MWEAELNLFYLFIVFKNAQLPIDFEPYSSSIKCRYNFCLWLHHQTEKAISETLETIDIYLKNNSFYCLANLYSLLGNVSEDFAHKDVIKQYFVKAQHVYQLERNNKMALELERFINETFLA